MKKFILLLLLQSVALSCTQSPKPGKTDKILAVEIDTALGPQLLEKWYPLAIDLQYGGYYSDITRDFKIGERQDKMIVSQARHLWTNAKAAALYGHEAEYLNYAHHGFEFLRDHMWDSVNGGFYNLVNRQGLPLINEEEPKTAYGNAFAIYGLSAYFGSSQNAEALELAKKTFWWLEANGHDKKYKGYFQSLEADGMPVKRTAQTPSTSTIGYKDQNSSIHLLEAFTSLYQQWPDPLLAERLEELLIIIRDTITTDKGYMNLFFNESWEPISFKGQPRSVISEHYYLDHVSFGHDVETAYLLLEAAHVLGGKETSKTLEKGKIMVDHALAKGWDAALGGFYDGGYYFDNTSDIVIVNDNKNWWTQAEGLNSLLLFSKYFPEDPMDYKAHFISLWDYTKSYLMDPQNGGWYEWGIDKRPESKMGLKGHIWKTTYHNYRSLANCKSQLAQVQE